jgi:hypothetical protein
MIKFRLHFKRILSRSNNRSAEEYRILTTWDNKTIDHADRPVVIQLDRIDASSFKISVDAPFFNDPPNPAGEVGDPFYGLWDYEGICIF